jgi:predicted nucleic acid-binding protein
MEREIVCLDTSILIDYFRKKSKEESTFYKLTERPYTFAVTTITIFEIYRGVTPIQKQFWDALFYQMEILSFDERSSKIAARLLQRLNSKNNQIALPDLFIAAIVIQRQIKLATLNRKHFEKIIELELLPAFE